MHGAFKTAIETGKTDGYTIDQFISMMTDAEWDDRNNRKIERAIKIARFHYKSTIENVIYDQQRNLDRTKLLRLAECDFVSKTENILITGSTGVGKSYIATALGYQACIEGYRVMYFNTTKLFSKLKLAKADGSYLKELAKLARQQLIILDDFGLQTLSEKQRVDFFELLEERHGRKTTIYISQIPVHEWFDIIGDNTIADAIVDRVIHQSIKINMDGDSMRKQQETK